MTPATPGASRPTSQDAVRRLLVLKAIVVTGLATLPSSILQGLAASSAEADRRKFASDLAKQKESVRQRLREWNVWQYVTPKEQVLLETDPQQMTDRQRIDCSWRLESVLVLLWALQKIERLPAYDTLAKPEILKTFPGNDVQSFISAASLRDRKEIDKARALAEFWHWRSRTRQMIERGDVLPPAIKARGFKSYDDIVRVSARHGAADGSLPPPINDDFPAMGKAYRDLTAEQWSQVTSVTRERHFSLNWLCGHAPSNHWDETPTGT